MRFNQIDMSGVLSFAQPSSTGNLAQVTTVIGKNNSGKSNVLKCLRLAKERVDFIADIRPFEFSDDWKHQNADGVSADESFVRLHVQLSGEESAELMKFANHPAITEDGAAITRHLERGLVLNFAQQTAKPLAPVQITLADKKPLAEISHFGSHPDRHEIARHFESALRKRLSVLVSSQLVYLSGWRNLAESRSAGQGVVKSLHDWSAPPADQRHLRRKFDSVTRLFRELSGLHEANLVPQSNGGALNIHWRGRYLPLQAHGDGFQHLLIVAFELVTKPSCVFLLEEIETHLHPEVQRRLMSVAYRSSESQFFLTTHSPVMIDQTRSKLLLRLEYDGQTSTVHRCETTKHVHDALDEIDARASDLLQGNVVIWVEGPTDRAFLKRCVELRSPELVEGVHYQFVVYGGRLRSHLTVGTGNDDLLDVIRLSRHAVLVHDSDKREPEDDVDATKKRLEAELKVFSGLTWFTYGREIENYFASSAISRTVSRLSGVVVDQFEFGAWDRLGDRLATLEDEVLENVPWLKRYAKEKPRFVRELVQDMIPTDLKVHDLEIRIKELVEFIKRGNGMTTGEVKFYAGGTAVKSASDNSKR